MDNKNISFVNGDTKFNYRVAVLIEYNGKVLLETSGDFWNMIGGRVQFGESSIEAAKRELKEELNLDATNLNLINVSENFFKWMGYTQQEMLFVYKLNLDDKSVLIQKDEFKSMDSDEIFKWHDKKDVKKLICKPDLIKRLINNGEHITHEIKNEL